MGNSGIIRLMIPANKTPFTTRLSVADEIESIVSICIYSFRKYLLSAYSGSVSGCRQDTVGLSTTQWEGSGNANFTGFWPVYLPRAHAQRAWHLVECSPGLEILTISEQGEFPFPPQFLVAGPGSWAVYSTSLPVCRFPETLSWLIWMWHYVCEWTQASLFWHSAGPLSCPHQK